MARPQIDDEEGLPDEETPAPEHEYSDPRFAGPRKLPSRKGNPNSNVRKAFASKGDDCTFSRWVRVRRPEPPQQLALLASPRVVDPKLLRRPAIVAGRSIFHAKGVRAVEPGQPVLVSGHSNVKIGRDVRKGPLRGYWIYTLTLEERATCPRTCHHWATCYGNNMPYARRVSHLDRGALEAAIRADVERLLSVRDRVGILVRLHALGDFYSAPYVRFWAALLRELPRLAVYGYTAWGPTTDIGRAVAAAKREHGLRFAVRWSNGTEATDCAVPVRAVDEAVNAIVCPEQTGKVDGCGKCGLCWGTRRNIAFLEH